MLGNGKFFDTKKSVFQKGRSFPLDLGENYWLRHRVNHFSPWAVEISFLRTKGWGNAPFPLDLLIIYLVKWGFIPNKVFHFHDFHIQLVFNGFIEKLKMMTLYFNQSFFSFCRGNIIFLHLRSGNCPIWITEIISNQNIQKNIVQCCFYKTSSKILRLISKLASRRLLKTSTILYY